MKKLTVLVAFALGESGSDSGYIGYVKSEVSTGEPASGESSATTSDRENRPTLTASLLLDRDTAHLKDKAPGILASQAYWTPQERAAVRTRLGPESVNFSDKRLAQAFLTFTVLAK